MNTGGSSPAKGTDWTCLNIAGSESDFTLTVQKSDVTVDADTTTLDFSNNFTVTSSPSGEANIDVTGFITGSGEADTNGLYVPALWDATSAVTFAGHPSNTSTGAWGPIFIRNGTTFATGILNAFLVGPVNDSVTFAATAYGAIPRGLLASIRYNQAVGGSTSGYSSAITAANAQVNLDATSTYSTGGDNVFANGIRGAVYTGDNFNNTTANKGNTAGVVGVSNLRSTGKNLNVIAGVYGNGIVTAGTAVEAWGVAGAASGATTNCPLAIVSGSTNPVLRACFTTSATSARTYALPDVSGTIAFTTNSSDITINKDDPTIIYDVVTATDTDFWAGVQDDAGSDDDDTYQIGTGTTPGSNTQLTLTNAGALTIGTVNTGNGAVELAAGVWTPTSNNIANLDSATAGEGQYIRVGNVVTGSVLITVDPTLATTSTQLELDLPVASDFGATSDAAGSCGGDDLVSEVAGIRADATSNELEVLWVTTSLASHEISCSFSYQIL